ncbi:protease FtsH-inhibitory lysogeny factor CIII [Pantoea sp. LMR881]|nr:protease FtsH-inhibitory lysogeny factor CIII [Pantoea sp. LMR881]MCZ4057831.1 protease FtsH-inhibitory lysogeny factor CIII [Pantoea sp. LMR881]
MQLYAVAGWPVAGCSDVDKEIKRNPLIDLLIRIAKTLCEKGDPL